MGKKLFGYCDSCGMLSWDVAPDSRADGSGGGVLHVCVPCRTKREASTRIVRDKHTCFGKPRLEDTRWYTAIVLDFDCDVVRIMAAYPHLSRSQIESACRFERSRRRRLGRYVTNIRIQIGAWFLGVDVDDIKESGL